jgi:hypothetical protein
MKARDKHSQHERQKIQQLLIAGGIVLVLAYAGTYLLATTPYLIRALGPILGQG